MPKTELLARIVRFLYQNHHVTRKDIRQTLHLTTSMLAPALQELTRAGVLIQERSLDAKRGRPLSYLHLENKTPFSLGIEFQANSTYAQVTTSGGTPLLARSVPDHQGSSWEERMNQIIELVRSGLSERGWQLADLRCLGIGLPGPVPRFEDERFASRAKQAGTSVEEVLAAHHLDIPVFRNNSVRLAAYGETWSAHLDEALYVRISDGIGTAFIVDGELYQGQRGLSGELGHWSVPGEEQLCFCGKRGCLETVANTQALCRLAQVEELKELAQKYGTQLPPPALLHSLQLVGTAIGQATLLWDTSSVILGGSLLHYLPGFFPLIEQAIAAELIPSIRPLVTVQGGMNGLFAGAYGAAMWAYRHFLETLDPR